MEKYPRRLFYFLCLSIPLSTLCMGHVEGKYSGTNDVIAKRAVDKLAIEGLAAFRKLLTGAKPLASWSRSLRRYEKTGNALEEFHSVNPKFITKAEDGLLGKAGNRQLILKMGDNELPYIEIRTPGTIMVERIFYKEAGQ